MNTACSPSKLDQNRLHCVVPAPVGKARKLGWVDHAISWVHTRKVDLVDELDSRWLVGVLIAAVHLERVDPVFVNTLPK
jgi:hypothetical protein